MVQTLINKMSSKFNSVKDRQLPIQISHAYKIPCSCGKVYNRHTSHHINTRLNNRQLAVVKHSTATRHSIDLNKTEVTANINSYCLCIIREATKILSTHKTSTTDGDRQQAKQSLAILVYAQTTKPTEPSNGQVHHYLSKPCGH